MSSEEDRIMREQKRQRDLEKQNEIDYRSRKHRVEQMKKARRQKKINRKSA